MDATGQPYAYTGDDPVDQSDPTGLSGDVAADEAYDLQHSCKGQYAHVPGCGQHWYQSPSLGVAADVTAGIVCVAAGAATVGVAAAVCIGAGSVATGVHVTQDVLNGCDAGKIAFDATFGLGTAGLSGVGALGRAALDSAPLWQRGIYEATTNAPAAGGAATNICC